MTTPPQQAQAQQPQQTGIQQAATVALILGAALSAPAAALTLGSIPLYRDTDRDLLEGVAHTVMDMPPETFGVSGAATGQALRLNHMRRAQFTMAAIHRGIGALADAHAHGQSRPEALAKFLHAERRYYGQHLDAMRGRMAAAARVDSEAMTWGLLLGWYAREDRITSPECRRADGRNFRADAMPLIGFPGAVHPHCRCLAGPPHPAASLMPSALGNPRARVPVTV